MLVFSNNNNNDNNNNDNNNNSKELIHKLNNVGLSDSMNVIRKCQK